MFPFFVNLVNPFFQKQLSSLSTMRDVNYFQIPNWVQKIHRREFTKLNIFLPFLNFEHGHGIPTKLHEFSFMRNFGSKKESCDFIEEFSIEHKDERLCKPLNVVIEKWVMISFQVRKLDKLKQI
jgi:hypothetical protein